MLNNYVKLHNIIMSRCSKYYWRCMLLTIDHCSCCTFTSEGEPSKVALVNGEHKLCISWSQLGWLEGEVIIKVA